MNPMVTVTGFWDAFVTKIAVFLPNLFFSIAILLLGWVICNVIKRIVVRLLKLCQFDSLAERAGIKQILEKGGIKQAPSDIIGLLAFWFLFLIAIVTTLETLNLERRHRYLAHDLSLHSQDRRGFSDVDPRALFREFFGNRDADLLRQCRSPRRGIDRPCRLYRHDDLRRRRHL